MHRQQEYAQQLAQQQEQMNLRAKTPEYPAGDGMNLGGDVLGQRERRLHQQAYAAQLQRDQADQHLQQIQRRPLSFL